MAVSGVDARELGCWSLFQVSALGMTDLLKSGRSADPKISTSLAMTTDCVPLSAT
jgi:hypothetical protein